MTAQNWINTLSLAIEETTEVPLFGHPPVFQTEPFIKELAAALQNEDLSFEICEEEWIEKERLLTGLGESPSIVAIALEPLNVFVYLAMSQNDAALLATSTLSPTQKGFAFQDEHLQKGYYLYAMAQILLCLKKSGNYPTLSMRLDSKELKLERSFCLTLSLTMGGEPIFARLIIPKETKSALKKHYLSKVPSLKELKNHSHMLISTHLSVGSVSFNSIELTKIEVGDFVILDHATYHPKTKKGYLQLNVGRFALLQIKIKEDQLKVLDYAYEIEGAPIMQEEDLPQDSSPIEDILNENEPAPDEFGALEEQVEEPILEKVIQEAPKEEKEPLSHPQFIPLTLSVELAKLSISLEKLLELQPGNVLNTSVSVESGVKLCLNGRPIAKGELMTLGDAIGVKITEIQNK